IVLKNINNVTIKDIKLVGLDGRSILVVIITDSGIIRDKIINVDYKDEKFLQDANNLINKVFSGKTVAALKTIPSVLERELNDFRELINSVLALLLSYCEGCDEDVILEGENKILTYPEASVESARNFLSIIDDRKHIAGLIGGDTNDIEFSVKIGKDETGGMDKCAIVTAKYMINGKEIGHAGVIGPERMDYSKVMSVLSYVGEALDTIIKPQGGKDEKK
ncbi:MAG: HrcA family transcriptional regulator, partial [Clostridia bacterium]